MARISHSHKSGLSATWRAMAEFPTHNSPVDWGIKQGEADDTLEATGVAMAGLGFNEEGKQERRFVGWTLWTGRHARPRKYCCCCRGWSWLGGRLLPWSQDQLLGQLLRGTEAWEPAFSLAQRKRKKGKGSYHIRETPRQPTYWSPEGMSPMPPHPMPWYTGETARFILNSVSREDSALTDQRLLAGTIEGRGEGAFATSFQRQLTVCIQNPCWSISFLTHLREVLDLVEEAQLCSSQ